MKNSYKKMLLVLLGILLSLAYFIKLKDTRFRNYYSSNIQESINNQVFLKEYDLKIIDAYDNIELCNCFLNAEVWKEKLWGKKPIIFQRVTIKEKEILILNPKECLTVHQSIRIEGFKYGGTHRENKVIGLSNKKQKLEDSINLIVFEDFQQKLCKLKVSVK